MNDQVKVARFDLDDAVPMSELINRINENPLSYLKKNYVPIAGFLSLQDGGAANFALLDMERKEPATGIKERHLRLWTPEEG